MALLLEHYYWRIQNRDFARFFQTPPGRVLLYISHIGMCRPIRSRDYTPFWSETGIDFAHFGLESGVVFVGNTRVV